MDEHDTVSRVGGHRLAGVEDENTDCWSRVNQVASMEGPLMPGRRGIIKFKQVGE